MLQFSYPTSHARAKIRVRKEWRGPRTVSSRCGAFEIINVNSSLSTGKPQIFYNNHTNELSIFHLCKISAIVCREIFKSSRRAGRNGHDIKIQSLLKEFTFPTWRSCGDLRKLYVFPISVELCRDRENTVKFSKSTVTPGSFYIPIPFIARNLIRNAFTSQSRSKRRVARPKV